MQDTIVKAQQIQGQLVTKPSSGAAATIANGNMIGTRVGKARVTAAGAVTGVIMEAGLEDGQICVVVHEGAAANTITMAAAGTSNVANGVTTVIAGLTQRIFVWNAADARWYTN